MKFTSVSGRNWIIKKYDHLKALKISEDFSLNEIVSRLLVQRDIELNDINLFLNPKIKNCMPNPNLINDMEKAVERTSECILQNKPIGIFGDYDVDGATSTALIAKYLLKINHEVNIYIPDRKIEGYGPTIKGFQKLIDKNSNVIITVDCGTSSFDPIKFSQEKLVDVIVLDHHQSDVKLPEAHAIVNPNRLDDNSNLNYLCAAGVCLMFLVALNKKLRNLNWFDNNKIKEPDIFNFLDLVCLGTICDVVPLIGLNRAIVSQGIKVLNKKFNLGLKTLYDLCNINTKTTTYHLGYVIGPRINAGGRVGKSSHGCNLLISNDPKKTFSIAKDLNHYNEERKRIESDLLVTINDAAQKTLNDPVIVLSGRDWHEGIIGIVASRIKDKYNKPVFLISLNDNFGKGSARSVFGFDIGSVIISAVQSKILNKGGGHKMAGGFTIDENQIPNFKKFTIEKFLKSNANKIKEHSIYLDAIISPSALNNDFYDQVYSLSPFGPGNSEPKFIIENLRIANSSIVGGKHCKVIFYAKGGESIKAIAFNAKNNNLEGYLNKNYKKPLNIAGKMSLNEWKGKKNIEFIIDDISVSKE